LVIIGVHPKRNCGEDQGFGTLGIGFDTTPTAYLLDLKYVRSVRKVKIMGFCGSKREHRKIPTILPDLFMG
jgi:hypothetical protein